jgi:hypothetical protein
MAAKYLYTKKYVVNLLTTVSKHAKSWHVLLVLNRASYELKIMTGRRHAKQAELHVDTGNERPASHAIQGINWNPRNTITCIELR